MVNGAVTSFFDREIVDQPSAADGRGGDQPHGAGGGVERFERRCIDQRDIVDLREAGGPQRLLRPLKRIGDGRS